MNLLETIEAETVSNRSRKAVDVRPGDTVRVHVRIVEGQRSRIQKFEGTVIRIKKGGPRTTITVRKIASGVGVERIFPVSSPKIEAIEVLARHKVRRAKLHYLRDLRGKAARLIPIRDFKASGTAVEKKSRKRGKNRRRSENAE